MKHEQIRQQSAKVVWLGFIGIFLHKKRLHCAIVIHNSCSVQCSISCTV